MFAYTQYLAFDQKIMRHTKKQENVNPGSLEETVKKTKKIAKTLEKNQTETTTSMVRV